MVKKINTDVIKSSIISATGGLLPVAKGPDITLGDLFSDVQHQSLYADGKTFADLVPRGRVKQLQKEYQLAKSTPGFKLGEFVARHFYELEERTNDYHTNPKSSPTKHIKDLWHVLARNNRRNRGSLVALPYPYIVPGGRFDEQFYWDGYFIMLGLAADGKWHMIESMVKNYAYMLRKFGFIPTANRTYFLSRSQPPFFSHMVRLLAQHNGKANTLLTYLPALLIEYRFWMKGSRAVGNHPDHLAYRRLVQMPNGVIANRYYDNKMTPRPESLREDTATAVGRDKKTLEKLYLDLRAGAESGWDFSSRWLVDVNDIGTIHTTDIVPVDLNCLLYQLENTIAEAYVIMKQPLLAKRFLKLAERRERTILQFCWDEKQQFFVDYDYKKRASTDRLSLAGVFPLYAKIATIEQAAAVAQRLEKDFLQPGGLVTTLIKSGQQWDSPNGWAPLQWVAIEGLRSYGYHRLADEIKKRWIKSNLLVFKKEGKFVEKYDVVHPKKLGNGGEYVLQDGFGWTNGVLAQLLKHKIT